MGPMDDWLYMIAAIAGLTAATVLTRASFFLLPSGYELPTRIERALRYAPACALAAIVAPGVLTSGGEITATWDDPRLWGAVAATAVGIKSRSMIAMIVVGMGVFTVVRLLTQG